MDVTVTLNGIDTTPPAQPTLTSTPTFTTQNSVSVEVNGEVGAAIWVNGANTGSTIQANGKQTIALDTSGGSGIKNFALTLKDAEWNESSPLNLAITKNFAPTANDATVNA